MTQEVDIFNTFATDTNAEKVGKLTTLPGCGPTQWRIARIGNAEYRRMLSSKYSRNRAALEAGGDKAEEKSNAILAEIYSETILVGWEGKVLYKGTKQEYSKKLAREMLAIKDFRDKVETAANDFATFLQAEQDTEEKNSETT